MKKDIFVDLDGVLNKYSGQYDEFIIPEPTENAHIFLRSLSMNYNITIFTARDVNLTKEWLRKYSLDKHIFEITNIKKPCFLFIDDRAISFRGNYVETIEQIEKFEVYWKKNINC